MDKIPDFDSFEEGFVNDIKNIVSVAPSDMPDLVVDFWHATLIAFANNLRRQVILVKRMCNNEQI